MTWLLRYDSSLVRLFFRIYFNVLFPLIAYAGDTVCQLRSRNKLLRGDAVVATQMTGWLSDFGLFMAVWSLRTVPGGWLGFLMLTSSVMSLGSDLISSFIQVRTVQDRCVFGTGLVVSDTQQPFTIPPHNGAPYYMVAQAQNTSITNGGVQGVYAKANRDLRFSADALDVLGAWNCTRNETVLTYPSTTSAPDIVTNIQEQGYLYNSHNVNYCTTGDVPNNTDHIVVLDSSAGLYHNMTFDVRAAIDMTGPLDETKAIEFFQCHLESEEDLGPILRSILPSDTLGDWCGVFQGSVYDGRYTGTSNSTGEILEQILNSMVMIMGGNNYLLNTTASEQKQGCVTPRTYVPWQVVGFAAAVAFLAMFLIVCWMYSVTAGRLTPKPSKQRKMIKDSTPNGVASWIGHAVLEHQSASQETAENEVGVEKSKLKSWEIGLNEDATHLILMMGNANEATPVTEEEGQELVPPGSRRRR